MVRMMLRVVIVASSLTTVLLAAGASSRALLRGVSEGVAPPALPPVSKMMNASSKTLDRMSKQLSDLGSKVADSARLQREQLAKKKDGYQKRLNSDAAMNDKYRLQNKRSSAEIWDLERGNQQLRDKALAIQKDNKALRKEFETVVSKAQAAESFVNVSLSVTDDSNDATLKVVSSDDSQEDDDKELASVASDNDEGASTDGSDADASTDNTTAASDDDGVGFFLEVGSRHRRARRHVATDAEKTAADDSDEDSDEESTGAEDQEADQDGEDDDAAMASDNSTKAPAQLGTESSQLIGSLQQELQTLAQQDKAGALEMDRLFQAQSKKLANDRAKILSDQKTLNHTHSSLLTTQKKLESAVQHLEGTKSKLQTQIRGLGHYLETLATYVLKPSEEAEKRIPSLTNNVASFVETQAWQKMRTHVEVSVPPASEDDDE